MQFRVPQDINLEDKIIGPLTLIQFIYLLSGGVVVYLMFESFGKDHMGIFIIAVAPVIILSLGLAFLKIQDQPLSHFIKVGIQYFLNPKVRLWRREGVSPQVIFEGPKSKKTQILPPLKKKIEKSELEKLAYVLDSENQQNTKNFGKATEKFEKILEKESIPRQSGIKQGGKVGSLGQTQK